jgi:hypothetical protein
MNSKNILMANDQDLAGSFHAIQRAAVFAEDKAISTNTSIVVSVGGKASILSAKQLLDLRTKSSLDESGSKVDGVPT